MRTRLWRTTSRVSYPDSRVGGNHKSLSVHTSGEGEHDPSWPVKEADHSDDFSDSTAADFAPRGVSKFQERIRNKLPKPLERKVSRQRAALGRLYDVCTV